MRSISPLAHEHTFAYTTEQTFAVATARSLSYPLATVTAVTELVEVCRQMAIRQEELYPAQQAILYRFPPQRTAAMAARRKRIEVRRRRAAAAGLLLVLICAFLLATGPGGSAPASRADAPRAVVIRPGDTLWGLAERYAPAGVDLRAYVDALEELNGLQGGPAAGMRLRLPK